MPLSVLIVDDEALAREGLRMLLAQDRDVSAVREARDGREAVAAIREVRPDLVLLDVQMPEMDGFGVVGAVGAEHMPGVVFVTAHDRYAMQAFELNAIDYLLKPVTEERFAQALIRAKARLRSSPAADDPSQRILGLLEAIAAPTRFLKRLAVRSGNKTMFVDLEDVDFMRAAENYVELHVGRAAYLVHVAMSGLEASLDPEAFLRIHRTTIVNMRRIKEVEPGPHGEYVVTLEDGTRFPSGRTHSHKLRALATNRF
jgi:two-component system, LytTR family, response regulator